MIKYNRVDLSLLSSISKMSYSVKVERTDYIYSELKTLIYILKSV